jgi:hypothetical protein
MAINFKFNMKRAVQLQKEKEINILAGAPLNIKYQEKVETYRKMHQKMEDIEEGYALLDDTGENAIKDDYDNVILVPYTPLETVEAYKKAKEYVLYFINTYEYDDLLARWDFFLECISFFTDEEYDEDALTDEDLIEFEINYKRFIKVSTKSRKKDKKSKSDESGKS